LEARSRILRSLVIVRRVTRRFVRSQALSPGGVFHAGIDCQKTSGTAHSSNYLAPIAEVEVRRSRRTGVARVRK
jgi:hypothetical protein